ncbi:uncharacterized protein BX664DRAFT_127947 [Halteromyces radiatus]|uniref:uncharacterized protein n=1 Tax=Halteromyces radiatus TaxID=101107 RepID=UPI00221EBFC1|nr:uncharacterized protein BX664DRAFT_127947 [Halteromyces radiatus]KAI8089126.1 hypothetical protein BX664DRAFT_127947 [Halteromyces radiatus]
MLNDDGVMKNIYSRKKRNKKRRKRVKKENKKTKKPRPLSTISLDLTTLDEKLLTATTKEIEKPTRPKMNRPVSWLSTMSTSHHVVPRLDKHKKSNKAMSRRSSLDSMVTTASQFEPITLEDRVRITFEIANILQKQDFLKKLAKSLMLYGCPAHRLEYAMRQVSTTLCVDAEYIYLPNVMLMSIFDGATHTTETHFIRQIQTFDMDKLSEIYRLEKLVSHGEVSVDEALEFIDQVSSKPPLYPVWLNPWVYAICSFSGCVMFFGGRWQEGGVAAALAMVFAGYEVISGRIQSFQPIWEITVCIIIGLVSQGLIRYDFCFTPVAFSAFIVVLPGYGMAIAIQELVSRQLVSGVVRMVYAIIYSFLLGYGVSMGSELYQTIDNTDYPVAQHCVDATNSAMPMASQSQWFNFLTVPLFAFGYCMYVRAKPHRWPTMTFVAACGFIVNYSLNRWAHAPSQVLQVAPSFVLGMLGHLLTKITGKMSFDAVLLGIFYLVPSSLGVKAALGLFGNSTSEIGTQGASLALSMIESSIGITVGLFLATLIVYPRGTQHTPLMTF